MTDGPPKTMAGRVLPGYILNHPFRFPIGTRMHQWLSRSTRIAYVLAILLMVATPILLVWQHYGMTRTLEISPRHPYGARVTDDRDTTLGNRSNGDSVATLTVTRDAFVMRCHLGAKASYPFCKFQFFMGDPVKGIDLSG